MAAGILAAVAGSGGARAQGGPSGKPLQIVVGFPPGQSVDIVARMLAERFTEILKRPVIVNNRPGQGGSIALGMVAKAAPDGDTITLAALAALVANPHLYSKVAYDTLKDFAPIGLVYDAPLVLVANAAQPFGTVAELIAYAKAHPGKLTHPSSGNGTISHLGMVDFKRLAGIEIEHVPYQGSAPAMLDLIEGRVQVGMDTVAAVLPYLKSGKLKALAACSAKRLAVLPDVPTIGEQGFPGFEAVAWIGLLAPAGTPPAFVREVNRAIGEALKSPDFAARLDSVGGLPRPDSPEQFAAYLKSEYAKWGELVRLSGAKVD
ncbi:MAG: tripartite tricarboxylate transporter substrate binding protein [Reyranellaceae bacterium]